MPDAFWQNLPALVTALALAVPGLIAAFYAKRSVAETKKGNDVAAQAVVASQAAQSEAKRSRAELGAQLNEIKDHTATIGPLVAMGSERNVFLKGKEVGAQEERSRTGNTGPGELR